MYPIALFGKYLYVAPAQNSKLILQNILDSSYIQEFSKQEYFQALRPAESHPICD